MPHPLWERLRRATDAEQVAFLYTLDDATCRLVHRRWGLQECACLPKILPCSIPSHRGDCDCLVTPDRVIYCEHQQRETPLCEWAQIYLLRRLFPGAYGEPPPPHEPSKVLLHEARVSVLEERRAAGVGLYHPADYGRRRKSWEPDPRDPLELLSYRRRDRNGRNGERYEAPLERC